MAEPGPANPTSRPQQVTYAGWGVVLGSVALVISAFQQIATLHSLDTRTTVERLVADQPSSLSITVDTWLEVLKVLGMVSGACAAAAAILGWQVLQRSRPARIALLVIGVPLVLAGLASGPIFALLVGFGVVVLWLPSASAWFDPAGPGKVPATSDAPRPPASPTPAGSAGPVQPAAPVPPPVPAPPAGPYGQQPPQPYGQPPYGAAPAPPPQPGTWPPNPYAQQPQQPYPSYAPYAPQGGRPDEMGARPRPVTAASIITIVLSGITAILGVILAVVGAAVSDDLLSDLADRGYDITNVTSHELAVGLAVIGGFVVVAALAAIVAAIFVLRRSRGARVVLTVFSALTILTSLVTITSIVAVLPLAGAIATIVLLHQRSSSEWFAGRGAQPPTYPPAR